MKQGRVKLDAKSYRELCRRVLNATVGAARIVVIHRIFRYTTLHGEANSGMTLRKTSSRYVRVVTETHMTALCIPVPKITGKGDGPETLREFSST